MTHEELLRILRQYFNESELHDLCDELSIDYEDLAGQIKADKTRELIAYCERRDCVSELEHTVRRLRPHAFGRDEGIYKQPKQLTQYFGSKAWLTIGSMVVVIALFVAIWTAFQSRSKSPVPTNMLTLPVFGTVEVPCQGVKLDSISNLTITQAKYVPGLEIDATGTMMRVCIIWSVDRQGVPQPQKMCKLDPKPNCDLSFSERNETARNVQKLGLIENPTMFEYPEQLVWAVYDRLPITDATTLRDWMSPAMIDWYGKRDPEVFGCLADSTLSKVYVQDLDTSGSQGIPSHIDNKDATVTDTIKIQSLCMLTAGSNTTKRENHITWSVRWDWKAATQTGRWQIVGATAER